MRWGGRGWGETATAVRGYTSTRYSDWHTAPRNARTPTGGDRLSNSDPAFLGLVCQSRYQVLVYPRTAVAAPGAGPSLRLRSGQALRSLRLRSGQAGRQLSAGPSLRSGRQLLGPHAVSGS